MPLPGNFQTITVNGNYVDLTGSTVNGSIQFDVQSTASALVDPTADTIILPKSITASISSGAFSVVLPATNDPDVLPEFVYKVTESFPSLSITRTYNVSIPFNAVSPINIADIAPVEGFTGTSFVPVSAQDEGVTIANPASVLNFTGVGINATASGGTVTVAVPVAVQVQSWAFAGTLAITTGTKIWSSFRNIRLLAWKGIVNTPSGTSAILVDLNTVNTANGVRTSALASQADRISIAAGSRVSTVTFGSPISITESQPLSVDIDQVGAAGNEGSNLVIEVKYEEVL